MTATRHKWVIHHGPALEWFGERTPATCANCGMERKPDGGTRSLYVFRRADSEKWLGYKAGHDPKCSAPKGGG